MNDITIWQILAGIVFACLICSMVRFFNEDGKHEK